MAITLGASDTIVINSSITTTAVSTSHIVDADTTLLMLTIHVSAGIGLSVEPFFNTTEAFELADQTTDSLDGEDVTVFTYRLRSPTATTANITFTLDSTDHVHAFADNWLGTDTSTSVTNVLSEDVNNKAAETNTSVHAAGSPTAGSTLYFSAAYRGGDGRLGTNDGGFTEQRDARTGTSNVVDISYIVAHKIGGAPSAITHTWVATDSNASHLIEILEPLAPPLPPPPSTANASMDVARIASGVTADGTSGPTIIGNSGSRMYQASIQGDGVVGCTATIEGTNEPPYDPNSQWIAINAIVLSDTDSDSDVHTSTIPWNAVRVVTTGMTGTDAILTVHVSYKD